MLKKIFFSKKRSYCFYIFVSLLSVGYLLHSGIINNNYKKHCVNHFINISKTIAITTNIKETIELNLNEEEDMIGVYYRNNDKKTENFASKKINQKKISDFNLIAKEDIQTTHQGQYYVIYQNIGRNETLYLVFNNDQIEKEIGYLNVIYGLCTIAFIAIFILINTSQMKKIIGKISYKKRK